MALISLAVIAGLSLFLSGCNTSIRPYKVASRSMIPLFQPGDRIFVDESVNARSTLHNGDVVALRHTDGVVIKRILALPGQVIEEVHGKVFRDGQQLSEPYLAPPADREHPGIDTFAPRTMGPEEIFVLGDNRDMSLDSRYEREFGPVKLSDVVGKYSWTYWAAPQASSK